ncbi:hypothetical protein F3I27_22555 [Pantoea sp. Bo_2]|nr:hypothetical protein F3I57_22310 [Pantoea sp. VH_3]KAA5949044.1 hypothetical protein F3I55_23265 [Pantoea sp. VH_24]KAA5952887.1 hypothetical protein F3I53_23200 [Pantoea sp. VH_16]KAA5954993.1 hypothetical protein F3I56_04260 [Pantoea sp. VH_25]KAA5958660.1 hypothetical protein F3I54_23185 [Pantoea sp. VH_18]KAA5976669.1 hypothetical protein F3I48_22870 [Pantoea sp. M_3]KAA5991310.1 hypothetical protein F3I46_23350 [Pantoea sp. M_1]KAA5996008.1 hypothetical protein F3I45_23020 [Pantoea s
MWITLCVTAYNSGFCCGMQRTRFFLQFMGCACLTTPYNAPPSTRHTGNGKRVKRFRRLTRRRKTSEKEVDSEGGKRNIRHLATGR